MARWRHGVMPAISPHEHQRHRDDDGATVGDAWPSARTTRPPTWDARCGYDGGLERRPGDMPMPRDVHARRANQTPSVRNPAAFGRPAPMDCGDT